MTETNGTTKVSFLPHEVLGDKVRFLREKIEELDKKFTNGIVPGPTDNHPVLNIPRLKKVLSNLIACTEKNRLEVFPQAICGELISRIDGLHSNLQSALDQLVDQGKTSRRLDELETYFWNIRMDLVAGAANGDSYLAEWTVANKQVREYVVKVENTVKEFEASADSHLAAIKNKLELEAPIEYWKKKSSGHKKVSVFLFFIILFFLLIFAPTFILTTLGTITGNVGIHWNEFDPAMRYLEPEKLTNLHEWQWGFLLIVTLTLLWILRLGVRLFLSNVHLKNDADQRLALLQTYISLTADKNTNLANATDTILGNLFRLTGGGLIKDDAYPISAVELITRPK